MADRVRGGLATLALVACLAAGALAQTPGSTKGGAPSPAPSPTPPPGAVATPAAPPAPAPSPSPAAGTCEAGQICVTAQRYERMGGGHNKAMGFVDLQAGDIRIHADQMDVFESPREDGTVSRKLVAQGNVVFTKGDERLAGERLEMQLDTNRGVFDDASGFVSPGVLVEARKIERVDVDTYKIEGGRFTSCTQPTPRWNFTASSATLEVDDKVKARNVVFRVMGVPALYLPYFVYPIQDDQRATGFLLPHFGTSGFRGFNVGGGFFWAMGRSTDTTFYSDYYSRAGWGFGHEFRYVRPQPSRGTFRSYFFRRVSDDGSITGWEYDLFYNAVQMLPGKVRASLQVQESSALDFQQQFQETLDLASRRSRSSTLSLSRAFGPHNAQLLADSQDTYFFNPEQDEPDFQRRRHLPSFTLSASGRRHRGTGLVFGYEGRAESLQIGNQELVQTYGRYDINPRISRPFSRTFLTLTPQVQGRYTRWNSRAAEPNGQELIGEFLERRYGEAGVEMRGPSFSRVFNMPGNFYSERYKHIIFPEATYTYRTRFEEFDLIPRFDQVDFLPGTNEVRYGIAQQFYAKRPAASGKLEPYEFLSWRVAQTYYVDIEASQFDPNYSSALFLGREGQPSHYSPIQSKVRFRPTRRISNNFDVEYDVNFDELRSLSASTSVNYTGFGLEGQWSRRRIHRGDGETRNFETARGSGRIQLLPDRLTLTGSATYDVTNKNLVEHTARLRYDVQCCGFIAEMTQSDFRRSATPGAESDRQWRFAIELANIGSIGTFSGQENMDQTSRFLGDR